MYCIMNNIKSRIKYITDLEFKIEDKYLVLGGYYNSLKRTTPRIIAKRITTFFLSDGGKSVVFYDQAYSGLFEDEFIKPILQKILSEAKQLFSTLSVDYKIIQDYLKSEFCYLREVKALQLRRTLEKFIKYRLI